MMPTVTIGENTGDDFSGCEDAWLWSSFNTSNLGQYNHWNIESNAGGAVSVACIKFSGLSSIAGPVTVSDAALFFHVGGGSFPASKTVQAQRILRNWIEGNQTFDSHELDDPDSCCWNEYGSGNNWTTAGCQSDGNDRSATISGSVEVNAGASDYEITSAQMNTDTQNFINGSVSNYGWHIASIDGAGDGAYAEVESSQGDDGDRPYLSVTYAASSSGNSYYYRMCQ